MQSTLPRYGTPYPLRNQSSIGGDKVANPDQPSNHSPLMGPAVSLIMSSHTKTPSRREAPSSQPPMLSDKVPVRDLRGRPLTPCSREKALQNLRDGLATWDSDGVLHLNYQPLAYRRIYRQVQHRDGYTCAWCGGPGSTLDHVIPICWGGDTSLDNCVIACRACNHSRNNALPSTFVRWTGYRPRHPIIRRILAREDEYLAQAQEQLKIRPLSACLSREEAQMWVAAHASDSQRMVPTPPDEPLTRLKSGVVPFDEYFVP